MTPILLWILCYTPLMTPAKSTPQQPRAAARQGTSSPQTAASRPASRPTAASTTQPTPRRQPPTVKRHGLRLAPNKSYTVRYHQFYRIQQTAFGKDTKVLRQHNITYKLMQVQAPTPHTTALKMTFLRVQLSLRAGLLKTSYDSLTPGAKIPAQAHILAAFVGHSLTVHLGADGRVRRVLFSPSMQKALRRAIKSHPIYKMLQGKPRDAMARQLTRQYGPTQWQREMANMWSFLPPHRVTSRWRRRHHIPLYGMTQRAVWSLQKTSSSAPQLNVRGDITTPRNTVTPFAVGATRYMRYDIKGTAKGTIQLDPRTRLPQKGRIHIQIKGQIHWLPPSQKKPKRTWPMLLQYIATWQPKP